MSVRNVRSHPLRSVLTTLGVVIGVATVITFVTLGTGLQADIVETIAGDNTDLLYLSAKTGSDTGLPDVGGGHPVFTAHDVRQLRTIDGVRGVAPQSGIATKTVTHNNSTVHHQWITVTTANYFGMKEASFVEGRPYAGEREEVVLNRPAAEMFRENVSVGDRIQFTRASNGETVNATVVGIVREPRTGSGGTQPFLDEEPTPTIYAPPAPLYKRTVPSPTQDAHQRIYNRIVVEAANPQQVEAVQGHIYAYLGARSDARVLKPRGYHFQVTTYEQVVDQITEVSGTFTAYITGVALISLVVGAIGIANIMLVSVTERTREIGIMKAIGAQKRDVLQLFMMEAVLLGVVGAIVGTVVGAIGGVVGTRLIDLPLQFRVQWVGIAILVGLFVGVVAGLYPAWNAARTDPIDALRYE